MSQVVGKIKLRVTKSLSSLANAIRRSSSNTDGVVNFGYQPSESTSDVLPLSVPTLRQLSVPEATPNIDAYRNPMSVKRVNRPSLHELHQEKSFVVSSVDDNADAAEKGQAKKEAPSGPAVKFGWIVGVFVMIIF